jgi:ADP-heptose:LPS heptosyltransferase
MKSPRTVIPSDCPRVLVIMIDYHLGDFTISMPVIEALAAYFANGIDLAVFHSHARLVSLLPSADRIRVLPYVTEKKKRDWRQHLSFLKLLGRVARRRYRAVFTLSGRSPCALLTLGSFARHRIGTPNARNAWLYSDIPSRRARDHRLDDFVPVLDRIGRPGRPPICRLVVPASAQTRAQAIIDRLGPERSYAVIHPTAGKVCRQWPAKRFAQVADQLLERYDWPAILVGTPAEKPLLASLRDRLAVPSAAILATESLDVTLALLRRCRLFVCNFSGPTHLAGLTTDAPIVCISGPTDKQYWAVLSNSNVQLLSGPICPTRCKKDDCTIGMVCMRDVSVADVMSAIEKVAPGSEQAGSS